MTPDPQSQHRNETASPRFAGLGNVVVLAASALVVFLVGTIWLVLFPPVLTDLGGASNLDRAATRVRIPVAGDSLDGWFLRGTRHAVVIVFHGYARDHTRAWRYAGFLHRAGYSVLAIDFRSSREPHRKPTTLGVNEVPDGEAAIAWARGDPRTRGDTIALLGESLGGSVALVLAARDREVAAVVADCPFATGEWAMEDGAQRKLHLPKWPTAVIARGLGLAFTGADPWTLNVVAAADSLRGRPVFLIHARRDDRFTTAQAAAIQRAVGSSAEIWLADGGHNEAWLLHRAEYQRNVLAFFDRHLKGGGHRATAESVANASVGTGRRMER